MLSNPTAVRARAAALLADHTLNWERFLQLAYDHSVLPQALLLLKELPTAGIPIEIFEALQSICREISHRQMANAAEFLRLYQRFQAEDILIVPYKGFLLGWEVYPHYSQRDSWDIDLFIEPEYIDQACTIMKNFGYQATILPGIEPLKVLKRYGEYNFSRHGADGSRLYHIEFHYTVGAPWQGLNLTLKELSTQLYTAEFQKQPLLMCSASAHFLLTALHHGGKDAWQDLRKVLDLAYFIRTHGDKLDWNWIRNKSQQYDAWLSVLCGIGLAAHFCRISVSPVLQFELEQPKMQQLIQGRIEALAQVSSQLSSWEYVRRRVSFLWQAAPHWRARWRIISMQLEKLSRPPGDPTLASKSNRVSVFFQYLAYLLRRISKNSWTYLFNRFSK